MAFDIMKMLGLGKKGASYDTYTSPQWNEQYNALRGLTYENLFPKYENIGKQIWTDEVMPGIREAYETKRNPYGGGLSDTPEFSILAREGRNLSSTAMNQAAQDYMNVQRLLTGMVGQPTSVYKPESNPINELITGGLALGGNLFSNYMQDKAMTDVYKNFLGGETAKQVSGDEYSDFFNTQPVSKEEADYSGVASTIDIASKLLPILMMAV